MTRVSLAWSRLLTDYLSEQLSDSVQVHLHSVVWAAHGAYSGRRLQRYSFVVVSRRQLLCVRWLAMCNIPLNRCHSDKAANRLHGAPVQPQRVRHLNRRCIETGVSAMGCQGGAEGPSPPQQTRWNLVHSCVSTTCDQEAGAGAVERFLGVLHCTPAA
jgi:hypothetical protein